MIESVSNEGFKEALKRRELRRPGRSVLGVVESNSDPAMRGSIDRRERNLGSFGVGLMDVLPGELQRETDSAVKERAVLKLQVDS